MCSDFNSSGNFYLNIGQLRKHVFGNNWNWPLGFIWWHLVYGPLLMADSFPWSERDSRNLLRYFSFCFSIPSTSSTFHFHILKWVIYVKISLFKTFVRTPSQTSERNSPYIQSEKRMLLGISTETVHLKIYLEYT